MQRPIAIVELNIFIEGNLINGKYFISHLESCSHFYLIATLYLDLFKILRSSPILESISLLITSSKDYCH